MNASLDEILAALCNLLMKKGVIASDELMEQLKEELDAKWVNDASVKK